MSIDPRAFRHTVGQFATGVTVIATEVDGAIRAMTANAFTSLSLDPPLVICCIGKTARIAASLRSASGFSVNILRQNQQDLSTYFSSAWKLPEPPSFTFTPWEGGPRLEGCAAALGCAVESLLEGGDHWILVGRVQALYRTEQAHTPLVFYGGRYVNLEAGVDRKPDGPDALFNIFFG